MKSQHQNTESKRGCLYYFLIIPIIILFISCGYHKDSQVYRPFMSDESYYMVRVWETFTVTNNGALKIYEIPMEGINDKKIDSINREADKFIENCKKIDNKN